MSSARTALVLLALLNLMNYYDRLLVVVLSQPLRVEFELTDTQYGLLTGPAFVFVYAVASIVFGLLADRVNRRALIAGALALWSAMTALCGFARDFGVLALGRAGVGIGEGGSNPAGLSLLSDHYPPARRPMALALFQVGGNVGLLLSFMVASWIATHYGWRAAFWVAGAPGLVLALVILFFLTEPPRGQYDAVAVGRPLGLTEGLGRLFRNKAYVWLSIAASLGVFSSLGMLIWLPQFFIRMHGMDQSQVGFLFGPAAALGLCAGMILGGFVGTRSAGRSLERPVRICIGANLAIVPLMLVVLWSGSTLVALLACFLAMALAVVYAPAFQATMQSVCEPELRGAAAAFSNVLNAIVGQGLIPLFVGVLSDRLAPTLGLESLRWSLTVATLFPLLCGLAFLRAYPLTGRHFAQAARAASSMA